MDLWSFAVRKKRLSVLLFEGVQESDSLHFRRDFGDCCPNQTWLSKNEKYCLKQNPNMSYATSSTFQSQQLLNLKNFFVFACGNVSARTHTRSRPRVCSSVSSSQLSLLRDAVELASLPTPPVGLDSYPPFHEWSSCPELLAGCEPEAAPLDVAVLLSGGVDSSLALHLLAATGHRVTAYYLQIWFQEDFRNFWDACPWEEDLQYCRAVCDRLGVPLRVINLTDQYWDRVVAHCIAEVQAGRTPNPDVLCNSRVKFGAFLEQLTSSEADKFDRVASGHYARLERTPGGEAFLALTPDAVKDQTYFLAHLTQVQLTQCIFPLGYLTKPQVRGLATAANLPNHSRPDSQGLCFLGKVRFSEFIKEHLGEWPGPLVEEETNQVLGYHQGFWFHTVGQRKGIKLSAGPWYVTRKDPNTNTVYISRNYHVDDAHAAPGRRSSFTCSDFSWTSDARPDSEKPVECKVRHGPQLYRCNLRLESNGDATVGHVSLDGVDQGLAAGQYAVFYQDGRCLGCAVMGAEVT
jgi:tRNA-5-taurinomethyluridine 2-sulfurtransferase